LEEQMYHHAQNLEFEEAARIRDDISQLRQRGLSVVGMEEVITGT
jgi:excinuclease ABC subunit B